MENPNQWKTEHLIATVREDCERQAKGAQTKLNEVVECLADDNHLGALGAFVNLDEDMVCLKVFLTRIAKLTARSANHKPLP